MPGDHLLNKARNLLFFGIRYPWVKHGRNVHVQWSTRIWSPHHHVVMGNDVGIGPNCLVQCDLEIGSKVLIAGNVAFVGYDDHLIDQVGVAIWDSGRGDSKGTVVEDDVWIGHGAIVVGGAHIGRGSVIGAGSVIVGEVAPYSIMIPGKARLLRRRFTEDDSLAHDRALESQGLDLAHLSRSTGVSGRQGP
jgi:acetyltransferase-like isoleucine patch superfamily enzyme